MIAMGGCEFKDWVVGIQNDAKSVNLCNEEKKWTMTSIYRVPSFIRDIRKESFTPEVASFGPYHHNADHLRPVEQHKRRALAHFLNKAGKPLDQFIQAMRSIEKQLQGCYHNLDNKWKNPEHPDKFLMLMILDGCFMLEVLRMKKDENYIKYRYAEHDPVFSSYGVNHRLPYIKRDMFVMENQLPLLVLKKLLEVEGCQPHVNDESINQLELRFFGEDLEADITGLGLHPLDVYRRSLLHGTPRRPPAPEMFYEVRRPAVELRECGVKFKKSKTASLADIDFKDGILVGSGSNLFF